MSPATTEQDRLDGSRHGRHGSRRGLHSAGLILGNEGREVRLRTDLAAFPNDIKGVMVSVPWCYTSGSQSRRGEVWGAITATTRTRTRDQAPLGGAVAKGSHNG